MVLRGAASAADAVIQKRTLGSERLVKVSLVMTNDEFFDIFQISRIKDHHY